MNSPQRRPRRKPSVVHYAVLDEMVVYCPDAMQAAALNESARAIWELCDGARTIDEICSELATISGASAAELRNDVSRAIEQLDELALLTRESV